MAMSYLVKAINLVLAVWFWYTVFTLISSAGLTATMLGAIGASVVLTVIDKKYLEPRMYKSYVERCFNGKWSRV